MLIVTTLGASAIAVGDGPQEPPGPHPTTDRVVLVELITAAWCPSCVNADGALEQIADEHTRDELVFLAWHRVDDLSFPDGDTRMAFYGSPTQPRVILDGVVEVAGNKGSVPANHEAYMDVYDQRSSLPSQLVLTAEGWTSEIDGSGEVWVNVTALATPSAEDARLYVVVFEDDYGPYNGGNGVEYHNWVAREMLTGAQGESLTIAGGSTLSFHYTYDASSYAQDLGEVGVVAFVQDAGTSKEVLQSAYVKEQTASIPNRLPDARPTLVGEGNAIAPGDDVRFEANADDADGDALSFHWDFGDGTVSEEESPGHAYSDVGTYSVTLTVMDSRDGVTVETFDVTVGTPSSRETPGLTAILAAYAIMLGLVGIGIARKRRQGAT